MHFTKNKYSYEYRINILDCTNKNKYNVDTQLLLEERHIQSLQWQLQPPAMLHQALHSLADCQDSVSKERDGQVTWWPPPWACGGALQSKEVSGGCSSGEGSRHRVCSPCRGSPTGVVVGQWVALPAVVVGILDPDSRKPSPQIQQVKWGMQVLTKQHSATCDRAAVRPVKISFPGRTC